MNQIKLIVSDLDGTLLTDNKEIDTNIKKVIKELESIGILFTIATGRNNSQSKHIINELGIDIPYVCDNGGSIFKKGYCIKDYGINFDDIVTVNSIFEKYKVPHVVYGFNNKYGRMMTDRIKYFFEVAKALNKAEDLNELRNDIVVKITVDSNGVKDFLKAKKEVDERCKNVNFRRSEDTLFTVTDIKSSKGNAVEYLANNLGLSLNNVMTFGDNYNDLTMIEKANIGVAMEDAKDEIKNASEYIALSNNKNGVSNFLIDYFKLKI